MAIEKGPSPLTAGLLSLFSPGLGQIYNGRIRRGHRLFFVFFVSLVILIFFIKFVPYGISFAGMVPRFYPNNFGFFLITLLGLTVAGVYVYALFNALFGAFFASRGRGGAPEERKAAMGLREFLLGHKFFIALPLILVILVSFSASNEIMKGHNQIPGKVLVSVAGVPFLTPTQYFRSGGRMDGPLAELSLHASLPEVGDGGAAAMAETGKPRLLSISVFPPKLYADMQKGNLVSEQITLNLVTLFEKNKYKFDPPGRFMEFRKAWNNFVKKNYKGRDGKIIDASNILGWDSIGTPPEENNNTFFVIFLKGRLVMMGKCARPLAGTFPRCWAYFQQPGDRLALQLVFSAKRLPNALSIAKNLSTLLSDFNEAAISYLGRGLTYSSKTKDKLLGRP